MTIDSLSMNSKRNQYIIRSDSGEEFFRSGSLNDAALIKRFLSGEPLTEFMQKLAYSLLVEWDQKENKL